MLFNFLMCLAVRLRSSISNVTKTLIYIFTYLLTQKANLVAVNRFSNLRIFAANNPYIYRRQIGL